MIKVAVIIPYFQRETGILRRALGSVLRQKLPQETEVEIIVVDDGSPVSASHETERLTVEPPFRLTIITQANASVSAARNAGLKHVTDATRYIAFLDSDDTWHEGHLERGVRALEAGYDFYFCDNSRQGHHESCFRDCCKSILPFIDNRDKESLISLTKNEVSALILKDFVTQASTTVYRRSIAKTLLFGLSFRTAGEDIVFFLQLVERAEKICFSPQVMVDCGAGINMYFSHLDWDSSGHIPQIIDRIKAHTLIRNAVCLSPDNAAYNSKFMAALKRNLVFHILRRLIKKRGKWPPELTMLMRDDKWFAWWFSLYAPQVIAGRILGLYHPD